MRGYRIANVRQDFCKSLGISRTTSFHFGLDRTGLPSLQCTELPYCSPVMDVATNMLRRRCQLSQLRCVYACQERLTLSSCDGIARK